MGPGRGATRPMDRRRYDVGVGGVRPALSLLVLDLRRGGDGRSASGAEGWRGLESPVLA